MRAAIDQGFTRLRLLADKLQVNGQFYTVKKLHLLPESLKPETVATKVIDNHTFYFTASCPLSNFAPMGFDFEEKHYNSGEPFFQEQKSLKFNDSESAKLIMLEKLPHIIKELGSRVKNYSENIWREYTQEIMLNGLLEKFKQNEDARKCLLATGTTTQVEAASGE